MLVQYSNRLKMSWDWVNEYPIQVYTRFLSPGLFEVRVLKGPKGNQNSKELGPSKAWKAPWKKYYLRVLSHKQAAQNAFRQAERWIAEGH